MHKMEAVHKLNPSIVTTADGVGYDSAGNIVNYDEAAVNAEVAKYAYKEARAIAYPSTEDQLDDIYHNGVDGWKTTIKAVKDKYPKS